MEPNISNENLISTTRLDWTLKSFDLFKSPGQDGIFPVLLQKGSEAESCISKLSKSKSRP